jgi:hypothetical protein
MRHDVSRLLSFRPVAACLCLVLCVAGGQAAFALRTGLICAIEKRSSDGMLVLDASLEAGATGFEGRYRFSIQTAGHAGQSTSVQSGQVRLDPGERKGVGTVAIRLAGTRVDAQLIVRGTDGTACTARY